MKWIGQRESTNVEDQRNGFPGSTLTMGGGVGTLILFLLWVLLGGDPRALMNQNPAPPPAPAQQGAQDDELKRFVSVVLADTEDVWHELFPRQLGQNYREPKLILFSGHVASGC